MSLDVSGLSAWTDENKLDLIKSAVLKGRTADIVNVQGGIKNSASINILGSTLIAQAGACGWGASGSTSLTQRNITVCDIKVNEAICLNTLEDYYTSTMMNPGSYNENIPFEQIFAEEKRDNIQGLVEDLFWRGDVSGGTGNLALCNGMLITLDGLTASTIGYGFTYSGALTAINAIDVVDLMVDSVPNDVIDAEDLKLFMSYADFRTLSRAYRDANLFHYKVEDGNFRFMVPGTNVEAIAVRGLNTQNDMVLTPASNLYLGTDLLNDAENFRIWYSEDNDEVRFLSKLKIGVNVAFPQFVVHYQA